MADPTPERKQPKRINLPTLDGKMGRYDGSKSENPFMKQPLPGGSSSFMSNPLAVRGPFSGGGQAAANSTPVNYNSSLFSNSTPVNYKPGLLNSTPVNYNPGLFPNGGAGGGAPNGGMSTAGFNSLFSMQNPFLSTLGGVAGAGVNLARGGNMPFAGAGTGAGGTGGGSGLHPEEMRWKSLADKYGVNWDVTKSVYMRSPRNPNFSPAVALNLQLDDKAWGDAARAAGILTGNPDYDNQVWIDHYTANGDMNRDPMAGHNYAQMAYQANQQQIQNMINGVPKPPEWL